MVELVGGIAIKESAHGPHFETYETYVAKMVKNWESLPMYMVTHGDHGTSVSDKIVQKTKNVVNFRFFLRIFFPAHFYHWKLR